MVCEIVLANYWRFYCTPSAKKYHLFYKNSNKPQQFLVIIEYVVLYTQFCEFATI